MLCNDPVGNMLHLLFLIHRPITPILSVASVINGPSDVLDMPVDPNEPTYCLCHQVSYGEMIGCDNPDVSKITHSRLLLLSLHLLQ